MFASPPWHHRRLTMVLQVVPILLIISIVLDAPKGVERVQGNDESLRRDAKINWKRFEEASEGLIKQFRYQGNILEVSFGF